MSSVNFRCYDSRTREAKEFKDGNKALKFLTGICNNTFRNVGVREELYFGQNVKDFTHLPVVIDFIFQFLEEEADELDEEYLFDETFLRNLARVITNYLIDITTDCSNSQNEFTCFMFETSSETPWKEGDKRKVGIRFFYPFCVLDRENLQSSLFREHLFKRIETSSVLKFSKKKKEITGLNCRIINSLEKAYQHKKFYSFYGCKEENIPFYELSGYLKASAYSEMKSKDLRLIYNHLEHQNFKTGVWDSESKIFRNRGENLKDSISPASSLRTSSASGISRDNSPHKSKNRKLVNLDEEDSGEETKSDIQSESESEEEGLEILKNPFECDIPEKVFFDDEEKSKYFLPFLFMMDFCQKKTKFDLEKLKDLQDENEGYEAGNNQIKLITTFLNMLNQERFNQYLLYIDVGKICYYSTNGKEDGFLLWQSIKSQYFVNLFKNGDPILKNKKKNESDDSDSDDDEEDDEIIRMRMKYNSFVDSVPLTIKTLAYYAREDNFEIYEKWHFIWLKESFIQACVTNWGKDTNQGAIANLFLRIYWIDILYAGNGSFLYYSKDGNSLIDNTENQNIIMGKYFKDFTLKLRKYLAILEDDKTFKMNMEEDDEENEEDDGDMRKKRSSKKPMVRSFKGAVENLIKKISTHQVANTIYSTLSKEITVDDLSIVNYRFDILQKCLNRNKCLFGCQNCVIELDEENKKATPREGRPEDFITLKSDVEYDKSFHYNHKEVKRFMRYLAKVHINQEIREFFLRFLSSFLYKGNKEKKMYIFIGDTNGSKTKMQNILLKVLGTLSMVTGPSFYTDRPKSGDLNPLLVQADCTNAIFTSEPDTDAKEKFRASAIKLYTGGDITSGRGMFGKKTNKIEACFKIVILLNCVPQITSLDSATKKRLFMIWFGSEFVEKDSEKLPATKEERFEQSIFAQDPKIDSKMNSLAKAMLWLMVQHYHDYEILGLKEPKIIRENMKQYWMDNDPLISFMEDHLERIPPKPKLSKENEKNLNNKEKEKMKEEREELENEFQTTTDEIYSRYRIWYRKESPDSRDMLKKQQFINLMCMEDKLGKKAKKGHKTITGWKLKEMEEEDEEETNTPSRKNKIKEKTHKNEESGDEEEKVKIKKKSPKKEEEEEIKAKKSPKSKKDKNLINLESDEE